MRKAAGISVILLTYISFFVFPKPLYAADKQAGLSAALSVQEKQLTIDKRAETLRAFLAQYDSPLASSADTIVEEADKNNIDWKLIPAISGVESTFCNHITTNSYNCWGWGIYGTHMIRFNSYDEAVATISKGLRENYMNKWNTTNIYQIGRYYAASPTWASRVVYFMNKIDSFSAQKSATDLSISI